MQTYTFTDEQLAKLLFQLCRVYSQQDSVYDFSGSHGSRVAVAVVMDELNGTPEQMAIPFDGIVPSYETDDNISEIELGLRSSF